MDRLEKVRQIADKILRKKDDAESRMIFTHLYGVSNFCSLLAIKRGLYPEICAVAGMLHDIWTFKTGDSSNHAKLGSIEVKKMLIKLEIFTKSEINIICKAIHNHSKKRKIHDDYDELLKDADVLHHYFYNISFKIIKKDRDRLLRVLDELDIQDKGVI